MNRLKLALLGVVLTAGFLRLYRLDTYPQNFNQDQMLLGYDAWSIWQTGRDQHGELLPMYFRSFNDYVSPVANYIAAPFVGILGPSEVSTRLPFALMGIATVFLTVLIGKRWFGETAGLIAGLLLACEPWHMNYSRIAFPASTMPFFTAAALYTFTRATDALKTRDSGESVSTRTLIGWFAASALSFALLTGSYPAQKIQAPMLLAACVVASAPLFLQDWRHWRHWRLALGWLAMYLLLISPLLIVQLTNWDTLQFRFTGISIFREPDWFLRFLRQYGDHYNLGALLFSRYGGGISVHIQGIGELFWLEGWLWLAAVIGLAKGMFPLNHRRVAYILPLFIGLWVITFPIASALTTDASPHEIRTYNVIPLPELLAGYGAVVVWTILSRYRWRRISAAHVAALVGIAVFVVFNIVFLRTFFATPLLETDQKGYEEPYSLGLRPVIEKVAQEAGRCDIIWLESTNQTYIYYLFLTRYPPAQFQKADVKKDTVNGWLQVPAFENVHFGVPFIDNHIIVRPPDCKPEPYRVFFVTHTKHTGPEWQPFTAVTNKNNDPIWWAVVRVEQPTPAAGS